MLFGEREGSEAAFVLVLTGPESLVGSNSHFKLCDGC